MDLRKNDIIKLEIVNSDLGGSGIGRHGGMAVFVPHSAKGDVINARILKVKKTYAYGKIEEILTPSEDRVSCPCPVNGKCGGCVFGHIRYEAELKIKEDAVKDCFRRLANLDPPFEKIYSGEKIYGYRNKAQYPVSEKSGEISAGFYASHSHRVIDCPACPLQPEEFETILKAVKEYIRECGVSVYNEETGRGLIRHIFIRKAAVTGEIMVCPVINGKKLPVEEEFCRRVLDACPAVTSIMLNINTADTNVIMGEKCRLLYGSEYITDILAGLKFRLSPLSFYQVNHDVAEMLYGKAGKYASLTGRETVLDLYCGTGTIGLSMAKHAGQVIGAEIVPEAVEDAKINAKINGIENARFICADAGRAAAQLEKEGIKPDAVILDPPRKGCTAGLIETVARMGPDRIVYVSCDPATLARDCKSFAEKGYRIESAAVYDMFPRTGNVETVCKLTRSEMNP